MSLNEPLIAELQQESASTRKMLERIPKDKLNWKPHEKSMSLGNLAAHIAEIPNWVSATVDLDELDFANMDYTPPVAESGEQLVNMFDKNLSKAIECLKNADDKKLLGTWKMRKGDKVYFELPKLAVLRSFVLSHSIHHRAQLSVYLRINDIPLPQIYGPTADESEM